MASKDVHPVTVIVPVYSDWDSLFVCLKSLKKYLAPPHQVFLVNDHGPEWQELESKILSFLPQEPRFHYFCNPTNLGFVKTCNRAVLELDKSGNDILLLNSDTALTENAVEEMLAVLYSCEKHGVVCPRSNNATLLSVPARTAFTGRPTPKQAFSVFCAIRDLLPRQSTLFTGIGFAFLTRRSLIDRFGFLDETYSPGYNEENDYCMRINRYGYSILAANRAFVYHFGSACFGSRRTALEENHRRILLERYPYYDSLAHHYNAIGEDPVDYFADVIYPHFYDRTRFLIDLYECPSTHNGTAQHCLEILESFSRKLIDKYEFSVLISREADEMFGISKKYPRVYYPDTILAYGSYRLCYSPAQIFSDAHLRLLNRLSLQIVFCMQDIISVRSQYLLARYGFDREDIFLRSLRWADGVVYISNFSREDTLDFYGPLLSQPAPCSAVVYEAATIHAPSQIFSSAMRLAAQKSDTSAPFKPPFTNYFFVIGNSYAHKYLRDIQKDLLASRHNFIVLGAQDGLLADNFYGLSSGSLDDETIAWLFQNSLGVLFPSVYEGFGLPIANALHLGKKILVNDNALNREQYENLYGRSANISFFSCPCEIEKCLDEMLATPFVPMLQSSERTWDNVTEDLDRFFSRLLAEPICPDRLRNRWRTLCYEENCVPAEPIIGAKEYLRRFAYEWPVPQGKDGKAHFKRGIRKIIRAAHLFSKG